MNSQIKQQWITALRSGEYTQTVGNLRSTEGYCCLGVLCDLYAKETGTEWEVGITADDKPLTYYEMKDQTSVLPKCVVEWAGLENDNPFIIFCDEERSLMGLNDGGTLFPEIAQLIEEKL